jgi:hypothetical protein
MVSIHFKILALDYSITNKAIRYLLAKNQFSGCSLNPLHYLPFALLPYNSTSSRTISQRVRTVCVFVLRITCVLYQIVPYHTHNRGSQSFFWLRRDPQVDTPTNSVT